MKISLKPKNIIVSSMEDLQHKDTEKCVYLGCPTAYLKGKNNMLPPVCPTAYPSNAYPKSKLSYISMACK